VFIKDKRRRNQDGTFKKDVAWTPWSESWSYKMSQEYKDVLSKTVWTFVEAFISALTVAPLVGVDANAVQLAALSGGAAALVVVKEFAKKQLAKPVKKASK
jgi:hypothetical protein